MQPPRASVRGTERVPPAFAADALALFDERGYVVFWSDQLSALLGLKSDVTLGRHYVEVAADLSLSAPEPMRAFGDLVDCRTSALAGSPAITSIARPGDPETSVRLIVFPVVGRKDIRGHGLLARGDGAATPPPTGLGRPNNQTRRRNSRRQHAPN